MFVKSQRLEVLGIQESKSVHVDRSFCRLLWDDDDFEWVCQSAQGASGGVILLWRKSQFQMEESFSGSSFVGVRGWWGQDRHEVSL